MHLNWTALHLQASPLFFAPVIQNSYCLLSFLVGYRSNLIKYHISTNHICQSLLVVAPQLLYARCLFEKYTWYLYMVHVVHSVREPVWDTQIDENRATKEHGVKELAGPMTQAHAKHFKE